MRGHYSSKFISCRTKKYFIPWNLRLSRKDSKIAKLSCVGFIIMTIGFTIFTTTVNATTHDFQSIQRHSDGAIAPASSGKPWGETPSDSLNSGNIFNALGSLSVTGDHILESRGSLSNRGITKLIKRVGGNPKTAHNIAKKTLKGVSHNVRLLKKAGKAASILDFTGNAATVAGSISGGDGVGVGQGVANAGLSSASAAGGAWLGLKGGVAAGVILGSPGGPLGMAAFGAIGSVVGAISGSLIYDGYGKPLVDKSADEFSKHIINSKTAADNKKLRLATDLAILRKHNPSVVQISSPPTSQEIQSIHYFAERVRSKQADIRAASLPDSEVQDRINYLNNVISGLSNRKATLQTYTELTVLNARDLCPNDSNKTKPGICGCGNLETDTDNDGTLDCKDECPNDPNKVKSGICGCGNPETDTDNDGTLDCKDECPNDPNKVRSESCGCGNPETDTDNDGTPDCIDKCPNDANKTHPGICDCGNPDTDTDNDGTLDCKDECPNDPNKVKPGICGCGNPETDMDNDGTLDCKDECPNDPNKVKPGNAGCGNPEPLQVQENKPGSLSVPGFVKKSKQNRSSENIPGFVKKTGKTNAQAPASINKSPAKMIDNSVQKIVVGKDGVLRINGRRCKPVNQINPSAADRKFYAECDNAQKKIDGIEIKKNDVLRINGRRCWPRNYITPSVADRKFYGECDKLQKKIDAAKSN